MKVSSVKWLYALHVAKPHFSCCKKTTRADAPTTTTAAVSDTKAILNEGHLPTLLDLNEGHLLTLLDVSPT